MTDEAGSERRASWPGLAGRLSIAIAALAGTILFYANVYPLHHDLAGSLLSGRLAVELGDAFARYSLYFPPAEKTWSSTIARLSDATGLRLDLVNVAVSTLMTLIGAELGYRIRRMTLGASLWFFVVPLAVMLLVPILFKNIFGLREPLIAAGLWPYIVLRMSDHDGLKVGRGLRVALGVWLGVTLLFKYLYAVVVALVELADALAQRRIVLLFRLENLIAGGIVALYLFDFLVLHAANRAAIGAMMSSIDGALADRATSLTMVARNFIYAVAFLATLRIFGVRGRAVAIGLALVVGALIAALAQQRWFSHHLYLIVMAYVAWWWMTGRAFRLWAHAAIATALGYSMLGEFVSTKQYREQVAEMDAAMRRANQSVADKRVGILNMHPSPLNQYLSSHRGVRWNATPNIAYVATELQPVDVPENRGKPTPPIPLTDPGRRMVHDQMIRLWQDSPPDVIILDESMRWPLRNVDVHWTQAFAGDPRFAAIMSNYRLAFTHKGRRLRFAYYVRAD